MKILYFDSWLRGIKHFLIFDKQLKEAGFQTELLHYASWNGDNVDTEVIIEGLLCKDVAYYKGKKLIDIIGEINPDVILGLNLYYLTDRNICAISKYYKIPYIYLSHGRLASNTNDKIQENKKSLIKLYRTKIFKRFKKNFFHVFPDYIYTYRKSNGNIWNPMVKILKTIWNPVKNINYSNYGEDLIANLCMVYSQKDKDFLIKIRKFPEEIIKVIGNPEMDFYIDFMNNNNNNNNVNENIILYLDDGNVFSGDMKKEEWYHFIEELESLAKEKLYQLWIKLHPKTYKEIHKTFFEKHKSIKIFTNEVSLVELIYKSSFCVSMYSTTILYCLLLGKKVISPRWGVNRKLLELYPDNVINYVYEKNNFWTDVNLELKKDNIEQFLRNEIGVIKEKSVPKIVKNISNLAYEKKQGHI